MIARCCVNATSQNPDGSENPKRKVAIYTTPSWQPSPLRWWVSIACIFWPSGWSLSLSYLSVYSMYYAGACNEFTRFISVSLRPGNTTLRRNVAAVASHRHHCDRFDQPKIWTSDLLLQRRTHYHSTSWLVASVSYPINKTRGWFYASREKKSRILPWFIASFVFLKVDFFNGGRSNGLLGTTPYWGSQGLHCTLSDGYPARI